MKVKLLWAVAALMCVGTEANAQIQIGGAIDLNRANIAVDPEPEVGGFSSRFAFGIGAVVDYPISNQVDLHGQLMLQGKGSTIQESGEDDVKWKTTWIEIPLQVRYTFRRDASVHPFIAAGPTFGFLRSARFAFEDGSDEHDEESKSFDAGLALSAGASMRHGTSTLFGSVNYVHGLVNVVDVSDLTISNRGLQLLLGVTFPVGK